MDHAEKVSVDRLALRQFRNIEDLQTTFGHGLNVIYGSNGQGKTNLLEGIFLGSTLRAFRADMNRELIRWESEGASVQSDLRRGENSREVEIHITEKRRAVRVNGKLLNSFNHPSARGQAVLFTPDDLSMVQKGPAARRSYLDSAIEVLYPRYAKYLKEYQQIVAHKNRILGSGTSDRVLLESWEERQVEVGSHIITARRRFIRRIGSEFASLYQRISGTEVTPVLRYQASDASLDHAEGDDLRWAFQKALVRFHDQESKRGLTVIGPHRDELIIEVNGRLAATFCSQGQIRMLSLCLRFAELEAIIDELHIIPILLLDDVCSELDEERNAFLKKFITESACQAFVTTTEFSADSYPGVDTVSRFRMSSGVLYPDC